MKICTICSNALQGQQQKYCSNKCKQKDHYHRVKEQTNTYHSQTTRALKRKLKRVCKELGENKYVKLFFVCIVVDFVPR